MGKKAIVVPFSIKCSECGHVNETILTGYETLIIWHCNGCDLLFKTTVFSEILQLFLKKD